MHLDGADILFGLTYVFFSLFYVSLLLSQNIIALFDFAIDLLHDFLLIELCLSEFIDLTFEILVVC